MVSERLEDSSEVFGMFLFHFTIHQDVIQVDDHKIIKLVPKYIIHEGHEGCWGIGEAKRKYKD